jgi:hypothetical protein
VIDSGILNETEYQGHLKNLTLHIGDNIKSGRIDFCGMMLTVKEVSDINWGAAYPKAATK